MKQCDIMKISEEEVAFVSEQESLEKGVSFIRDNSDIKILFVTLGNKGSIAYYKDEKIYCGGIHQEHVVDTTGAGDAYIAAIMDSYYCEQKSKQESMKDAAVVAALKTMQTGPRFSMDREKLEEVRTMYIS